MIPLNPILLFGLVAVAIPILIHILNRRRANVVEWGAMQFLVASLASRNRRIQVEELILMALRCLLLAVLVLALARWFVRGRLLGGGKEAQDLAIVVDGSLSMHLESGGKSNFQRAVEEARRVVDACRSNDAGCILLAGPTPLTVVSSPLSDRQRLHAALDELAPPGGSMNAPDALYGAVLTLAGGTNPGKKIVLITDGQRIGWNLSARQRWEFLANSAAGLATPPTVIVRTLQPPRQWRNVAAANLTFGRSVIGTDRPVRVTVTVANTGKGAMAPQAVELQVNGRTVESRPVGQIAEGASGSVVFDYQFTEHGPHLVRGEVICEDDLLADNDTARVVDVCKVLPVLIVEGQASPRLLGGDADFLRLALAPPPEQDQEAPVAPRHLIEPTVVAAADIASVKDFSRYPVVVLADVPRLPAAAADSLLEFARTGGLLVAPGEKADREFYNNWTTPDGRPVIGCRLREVQTDQVFRDGQERLAHVAPNTLDHPALKLLADPAGSDLPEAGVRRHWALSVERPAESSGDSEITVAASLDTGEPCLVQRRFPRGFVLTLAFPLDRTFTDLAVHECFVPLVHELIYYLAAPGQPRMNVEAGEPIHYVVPGQVRPGDVGEMIAPDGERTTVKLQQREQRWHAEYVLTAAPGLYRLALPDAALGELATRPAVAGPEFPGGSPSPLGGLATASASAGSVRAVPFVVLGDPDESRLDLLEKDDYKRAGQHVRLLRAETLSDLLTAVTGEPHGGELWQTLVLLAVGLVLLETVATRWIALRRKAHLSAPVAFGTDQVDAERFRARAREMLEVPAERTRKEAAIR